MDDKQRSVWCKYGAFCIMQYLKVKYVIEEIVIKIFVDRGRFIKAFCRNKAYFVVYYK